MDSRLGDSVTAVPLEDNTFVDCSAATSRDELSPSTDDKPLPRQKRKRTSPEDQATLEAAYNLNSKPDKAARLELVKQVALGEKEVQIWFQNRRQSSRRKARPLLPHEVVQYQMARTRTSGSVLGSSVSSDGCNPCSSGHGDHGRHSGSPESSDEISTVGDGTAPDRQGSSTSCTAGACFDHSALAPHEALPVHGSSSTSAPVVTAPDKASSDELLHGAEQLANQPDGPRLAQGDGKQQPRSIVPSHTRERRLRKSASCVRLSMNAEGKAEIVTKDAASPSPPRPLQTARLSQGSISDHSAPPQTLSDAQSLQRSSSGRSRDSRSWAFWCDKEARSELEHAAEKDANGSAAGAIGLLRTASGRNVLGSLPCKRNSGFGLQPRPSKRTKLDPRRPILQRAKTSTGRLQSKSEHLASSMPSLKHSDTSVAKRLHGSDSDKENWSPDLAASLGNVHQSQDSTSWSERSSRTASASISQANRKTMSKPLKDDVNSIIDPENDPELVDFMRARSKSTNVSEDDDLDCVQGLLSLSQGNWR